MFFFFFVTVVNTFLNERFNFQRNFCAALVGNETQKFFIEQVDKDHVSIFKRL